MATPATRPAAPPSTSGTTSPDWTVQVADTIESVVGSVRDKTAVPLETVARALVYGIVLGTMGTTAALLVTIAGVRALSYVLEVWAAYLVLGAIFTGFGMLAWSFRRPRKKRDKS